MKNAATVTLGKMLQSKDSGGDVRAPYMRAANVQPDGVLALDDVNEMWFASSEMEQLSIRSGDVVVVEGGQGGFGRAAFAAEDLPGWGFQNSINRLRPTRDFDGRFIAYYLIALRASGFIRAYSNVVSMPHLTAEKLARIPMPLPPLPAQSALADYLDRETARIDILIQEQRRLIETLSERRAAVITQAATRGLDGSPLSNSGNVYLGDVPAHWVVSRFSREMSVNGGQVDPRVDPWAHMVLVAPNHIESGTGRIVGRETALEQGADSGKYLASAGQILFSKIRPALNKVTLAAEDCLTSADMYAMSSRHDDDHRYLMYFMLARPFHAFVTLASLRVKMPKVNRDELGEAPFLRPPKAEQRRIAAYLDEQTSKIDTLMAETEQFIELSRERRTALITAAVTGQIDVREMV
ncbi:restriction endonuclease subunit S [Gordonia sp. NPDC057258]|uniref:restriction endonuclease subunit S n=1 Tax=unclassified Gordonia (in: high G+C Gram-positive bacteria) TaxID=2657482 RepID=UPI003632C82D